MRLFHSYMKFSLSMLLCLGLLPVLVPTADHSQALAEDAKVFTNASLDGTYAIHIIGLGGDAPLAGISIVKFDGQGNTTSNTPTLNLPGPAFGDRFLLPFFGSGTHTVNPDGTGSASSTFTFPDGSTAVLPYNFVITKTRMQGDRLIATEISFVVQTLAGPSGTLNTFVATRLPARGEFTTASLQGDYALVRAGRGGQAQAQGPEAGVGAAIFDGNGNFAGRFINNQRGASIEARQVVDVPFEGTYTVQENGTGTIESESLGGAILVITRVEVMEGVKVATEFFFIRNDLSPNSGNLITTFATKR